MNADADDVYGARWEQWVARHRGHRDRVVREQVGVIQFDEQGECPTRLGLSWVWMVSEAVTRCSGACWCWWSVSSGRCQPSARAISSA